MGVCDFSKIGNPRNRFLILDPFVLNSDVPRQRKAWQKQMSLSANQAAKKKSKRIDKELTKIAKKTLSQKWRDAARLKLKTQPRQQLAEKLLPKASLAKAKSVKKSSLKKKKVKSLKKHESAKQLKDVKKQGAAALANLPSDSSGAIGESSSIA